MKTKTKTAPAINQKLQRLFNIEIKSINEEERTVDFVFSDDSIDRYGERVDQASWELKSYEKNPILLWGHDPSEPENVIGGGDNFRLNQAGDKGVKQSLFTAQFDTAEVNEKADLVYRQVRAGRLRTVSAGFIPHTLEWEDDVPVLKDNELLEISIVAIPANRNAVALAYKSGEVNQQEAEYLMKSMRDGAEAIEAQLKDAAGGDDDKDARIAELETQLAEANQRNDELTTENEELKANTPPEGDDSAKGGDDDQPGAEDDIDLDAELSDEDFDALEVTEDEESNE